MEKDIRFTGYTASPSDYESTDGELAQSYNLINEEGALHSILPPKTILMLEGNAIVKYLHRSNSFEHDHYIVYHPGSRALYWMNDNESQFALAEKEQNKIHTFGPYENLNVSSIGNTLIVIASSSVHYILWTDGTYKYLGDHIPDIELSFGLKGYPKFYSSCPKSETDSTRIGYFDISYESIATEALYNEFSESNKNKITEQVMAKVNKFLREETIYKGRFGLPFFVRYALRLYDGSLVCHSAPILMNPTTGPSPCFIIREFKSNTSAECDVMLVPSVLDYRLIEDKAAEYVGLNQWSDIVKSVDIFVSAPIYGHDQSGFCERFSKDGLTKSAFVGAIQPSGLSDGNKQDYIERSTHKVFRNTVLYNPGSSSNDAIERSRIKSFYAEWRYDALYALYNREDLKDNLGVVELPKLTKDAADKLKSVANFYLLSSIDIKDIQKERTDISVPEDYLQSLTSRELMSDDYLSHDHLSAKSVQPYNNRLNLSGVSRKPFKGFSLESMMAYCNASMVTAKAQKTYVDENGEAQSWYDGSEWFVYNTDEAYSNETSKVFVYIKENGSERVVAVDSDFPVQQQVSNARSSCCYYFYPNVNAYKLEVFSKRGASVGKRVINLKPHDFLNGAFCLETYGKPRPFLANAQEPMVNATLIAVLNKLYTSDINNPFRFDMKNISTIGTGEIIGISTAAKALSQGQFGQFPLYAFTDEGVWALEVSSTTGGFSAKQPITRDVCINADSITQVDSSVLFATKRGIMELSGSTSTCISDILNGRDFFDLHRLPGLEKLYTDGGLPTIDCSFEEYRKVVRMAYDYVNQRIVVFNPTRRYAYVFSLKTKLWGVVSNTLSSVVNAYPASLAMSREGLVDLSQSAAENTQGLIVTRPLRIDGSVVFKTIDTIYTRGLFELRNVSILLYGSRDNISWHLVQSSKQHYLTRMHGTPYRFFRIAIVTRMSPVESVFGASVSYIAKLDSKMR